MDTYSVASAERKFGGYQITKSGRLSALWEASLTMNPSILFLQEYRRPFLE